MNRRGASVITKISAMLLLASLTVFMGADVPKPDQAAPVVISLVMPTTPTAVGDMVVIAIKGVPATSLPKLRQWVWPSDGTQLIVGQGLQPADPAFMVFAAKAPGTYKFIVVAPDGTGDVITATQVLVVTGVPLPPGPNPPGPLPPGPNPPVPQKLRVLVLYDPATLDKMDETQRELVYSAAPGSLRDYLDSHVLYDNVKDAAGGILAIGAKRVWPVNVDPAPVSLLWQPLLRAADGKPGIVVQVGADIQRFDLPASNAAAIKLLEPLGGK